MAEEYESDPTRLCISILKRAFPDIPITSEIPFERPPAPLIQISRTGGEDTDFVSKPVMQMLCWGGSDPGSQALCMDAVSALRAAAEEDKVLSSVVCQSVSRDEWTVEGEARYRAQLNLVINV